MRTQKQTDIWYLAGPMTGHPQFNFPLFIAAALALRDSGFTIVSPAELDNDEDDTATKAIASTDGNLLNAGIKKTWGDLLARDVKLITDEVDGIVFLPGWDKSKGARLEAFVAILAGKKFGRYVPETASIELISPQSVLTQLVRYTHAEIRDGG